MAIGIRGIDGPFPVLQAALDFIEIERALRLAQEAVAGGADWIEAGTPLIKSEGFEAVRKLRSAFPSHVLIADLKTMDAGRVEFEAAANAGASIAVVLAAAADATIRQCVEVGRKYGVRTFCDTLNIPDDRLGDRVQEVAALGVDIIGVNMSVDEQMLGLDPLARVKTAVENTCLPVAVCGGVTSETAPAMISAGADIATRLGLPLFSTTICSHTAEPKGYGEIGTEVIIGGQTVRPGDWIFGDDDGVMVLPQEHAVEYANRAVDVMEAEERLVSEIRSSGKTMAELANFKKWEKH